MVFGTSLGAATATVGLSWIPLAKVGDTYPAINTNCGFIIKGLPGPKGPFPSFSEMKRGVGYSEGHGAEDSTRVCDRFRIRRNRWYQIHFFWNGTYTSHKQIKNLYQVIQFVPFSSRSLEVTENPLKGSRFHHHKKVTRYLYPQNPCMVYLPTFTIFHH